MNINGIAVLFFLLLTVQSQGQGFINLKNPSFEDYPRCCTMPKGWYYYGHSDESPPDIQPGSFDVATPAFDGKTYLGLVLRDNKTWEGIGQDLETPLRKGYLYEMTVALAKPKEMNSISRLTGKDASFTNPVLFRIWGVDIKNNKEELLAETTQIDHIDWTNYEFTLMPRKRDYPSVAFTVWYVDGLDKPYNGYILVDKCSVLKVITP